ncbi:hypothetical protein CBM2604_B150067 [Cupriavidus taiwanensis]|nr:hypothetical protein CBM2604_B150067 [Cupriavidus taiwanensis]
MGSALVSGAPVRIAKGAARLLRHLAISGRRIRFCRNGGGPGRTLAERRPTVRRDGGGRTIDGRHPAAAACPQKAGGRASNRRTRFARRAGMNPSGNSWRDWLAPPAGRQGMRCNRSFPPDTPFEIELEPELEHWARTASPRRALDAVLWSLSASVH